MSLVHKEKYEQRLSGMEKIIGRDLEIVWGPDPKTDGRKIYLPDDATGIWDNEDMIRAGFSHEVAHNMFESDIRGMGQWINTWSNEGNKFNWHDPYDLMVMVAESVIQVLEDQRIESLYGELYPGAKERFAKVLHHRIAEINDPDDNPATALLLLRTARWNIRDLDSYTKVSDEWDDDEYVDPDFLWDALDRVENADMDATFLMAEQVMQHIAPWYEERIRWAEDEDIEDMQQELQKKEEEVSSMRERLEDTEDEIKEKEREQREAEADGDWERADELDEKIEELEEQVEDIERDLEDAERERDRAKDKVERETDTMEEAVDEIEDIKEDADSIEDDLEREDYDPPEDAMVGDTDDIEEKLEESEEQANRKLDGLRKEMKPQAIPDMDAAEAMDTEIVEKESVGAKKGEVYWGIVNEIKNELRQIRGRKRQMRSSTGTEIDIDALIQDQAQGGLRTDIMREEVTELGFCCAVVLDLSMSMIGPKLNVCRNVGSTLYETFEQLSDEGMHVSFPFIGYGGHHIENKVMIKECESTEAVKKLTHDPNFANTPTWHAVEYARRSLRSEEGDKMMVIVTDGTPTGLHSNQEAVKSGRALTYTKREIQKAESRGIDVFTLGIGVNLPDSEMRRIYGRYENVDDESEAGQVLLDFVRGNLRRHVEML